MEAAIRIGQRLRTLREERGWTQTEVAKKADVSQPTIAGIESGAQLPGTGLLGRLADMFRVDLDYFYRAKDNPFEVLLRTEDIDPHLRPTLRRFTEWCMRYSEIERIAGQVAPTAPDYASTGARAMDSYGYPERVAEEARLRLHLGAGQNHDLPEALERDGLRVLGVKVKAEIDGVFLFAEDEGGFALINTSRPAARQLFTLAHEYGHYLIHRKLGHQLDFDVTAPPSKGDKVESAAGRFAAAFLMPRSTVESWWEQRGKDDLAQIIWLRRILGVSYRSLGWRLLNLRLISATTREKLEEQEDAFKKTEKLLFTKEADPCLKIKEFSDRLRFVSLLAYLRGEVTVSRLADWLDVDITTADGIARALRGEEEPNVPTAH